MKHWHGALAICLSIAGCRYRYELLPAPAGQSAAGAAGAASLAGSAGSGDASGGADGSGVGGSDGDAAGSDPGGGEGGASLVGSSGAGGDAASGGSDGAAAPNLALCEQGTYGGHDYLLCEELRTWGEANEGCIAIGMRLVRVDDANENGWLFATANTPQGSTSQVWLGATDQAVEGEWRWSDGELFWVGDQAGTAQNELFSSWYFREPNDVDTENCAVLETKSVEPEWYDHDCEALRPYVCEAL